MSKVNPAAGGGVDELIRCNCAVELAGDEPGGHAQLHTYRNIHTERDNKKLRTNKHIRGENGGEHNEKERDLVYP